MPFSPIWLLPVLGFALGAGVALFRTFNVSLGGPLSPQDWLIWIFGGLMVGGALLDLFRNGLAFNRRWILWLPVGATLLYAEVFNVTALKEIACQTLLSGRHHRTTSGPCYRPAAPALKQEARAAPVADTTVAGHP
jgi:hypothetical protein